MVIDDLDELFNLFCFGVFEIKFESDSFAEIVWRNPVDAALGHLVIAVIAAVFEQEFVEIQLQFVAEIIGGPFVSRATSFEVGNSFFVVLTTTQSRR